MAVELVSKFSPALAKQKICDRNGKNARWYIDVSSQGKDYWNQHSHSVTDLSSLSNKSFTDQRADLRLTLDDCVSHDKCGYSSDHASDLTVLGVCHHQAKKKTGASADAAYGEPFGQYPCHAEGLLAGNRCRRRHWIIRGSLERVFMWLIQKSSCWAARSENLLPTVIMTWVNRQRRWQ